MLFRSNAAAGGGEPPQVNVLWWLIKVSGWIGLFILILSIYFVAVAIQAFLQLKLSVAMPPESTQAVTELIEAGKTREVVEFLKEDDSMYGQSLLAGIADLKYGLDDAREKLDRKAEALSGDMERSISNLAVLGTLGPMIGLLGTLKGMITSFSAIAISGTSLDASKIAEGISEALVLTFEGVFLSVPAIFLFSFFRNRIAKIYSEVSITADDHLRAFAKQFFKNKPEGSA